MNTWEIILILVISRCIKMDIEAGFKLFDTKIGLISELTQKLF